MMQLSKNFNQVLSFNNMKCISFFSRALQTIALIKLLYPTHSEPCNSPVLRGAVLSGYAEDQDRPQPPWPAESLLRCLRRSLLLFGKIKALKKAFRSLTEGLEEALRGLRICSAGWGGGAQSPRPQNTLQRQGENSSTHLWRVHE